MYISGLEADQKVIAAHQCYSLTATTALTAQNTLGVQDIHITPPEFVGKQINACLGDVGADVVKMGALQLIPRLFVHSLTVSSSARHAGIRRNNRSRCGSIEEVPCSLYRP